MFVRLSRLKKVVAEQAAHLFEELRQEDVDRLRRAADGYPGESQTGFEEAIELEDFEFGEAKKKDEEEPEDVVGDEGGEEKKEKPAFLKGKGKGEPKKKSPPKEKETEEDSGEEEEQPKKEPSPKHKKAKKGLEKAQKQKSLPKSQVDPKTGMKQDIDLDQLAQLATEMGYRLERNEPEPEEDMPEDDLGMDVSDELPGDDDEMNFDLGSLGDLGGEDEEDHDEDVEGEDVALFSSDEDLGDVLGLGAQENDEDELGLEGNPLSMKKSLPVAKQGSTKQGGLKLRIK